MFLYVFIFLLVRSIAGVLYQVRAGCVEGCWLKRWVSQIYTLQFCATELINFMEQTFKSGPMLDGILREIIFIIF